MRCGVEGALPASLTGCTTNGGDGQPRHRAAPPARAAMRPSARQARAATNAGGAPRRRMRSTKVLRAERRWKGSSSSSPGNCRRTSASAHRGAWSDVPQLEERLVRRFGSGWHASHCRSNRGFGGACPPEFFQFFLRRHTGRPTAPSFRIDARRQGDAAPLRPPQGSRPPWPYLMGVRGPSAPARRRRCGRSRALARGANCTRRQRLPPPPTRPWRKPKRW
jgi:hypothetical protein